MGTREDRHAYFVLPGYRYALEVGPDWYVPGTGMVRYVHAATFPDGDQTYPMFWHNGKWAVRSIDLHYYAKRTTRQDVLRDFTTLYLM